MKAQENKSSKTDRAAWTNFFTAWEKHFTSEPFINVYEGGIISPHNDSRKRLAKYDVKKKKIVYLNPTTTAVS